MKPCSSLKQTTTGSNTPFSTMGGKYLRVEAISSDGEQHTFHHNGKQTFGWGKKQRWTTRLSPQWKDRPLGEAKSSDGQQHTLHLKGKTNRWVRQKAMTGSNTLYTSMAKQTVGCGKKQWSAATHHVLQWQSKPSCQPKIYNLHTMSNDNQPKCDATCIVKTSQEITTWLVGLIGVKVHKL